MWKFSTYLMLLTMILHIWRVTITMLFLYVQCVPSWRLNQESKTVENSDFFLKMLIVEVQLAILVRDDDVWWCLCGVRRRQCTNYGDRKVRLLLPWTSVSKYSHDPQDTPRFWRPTSIVDFFRTSTRQVHIIISSSSFKRGLKSHFF